MMPESNLLQDTDGQRVAVFFAVAGFDRGDDHENDPEDENHREDEQSDEDEAKDAGHGRVDGVADLEVEDFLAGAVEERALGALDQPEDERGDDVAERENKAGETEQVHDDRQ